MAHRMNTTGFTELRVVTTASWLARDLATGTDLPVVHDYGLDVGADVSTTAWWSPHGFVARLAATPGVAGPHLMSPGPGWMDSIGRRWTSRELWCGPLETAADCALWSGPVFAKPAEIKRERLPAAVYTDAGTFARAASAGLLPSSAVVLSALVRFTAEFRCFVAPGPDGSPTVVAACAYLVDGQTWDFWERADQAPDPSEAAAFAQLVVDDVVGPPGFVLDVGRLADGSWAVVEPNASWSSNPYHCGPAGVVASILAAQDPAGDDRWVWASDPVFDQFARPLPVRDMRA
jgi:hypothetical protein